MCGNSIIVGALLTILLTNRGAEGFNVVNYTTKTLTRPGKTGTGEEAFYFGHNFIVDTSSSNESRLLVGSFNVPADDLHSPGKQDGIHMDGRMFNCNLDLFSTNETCSEMKSSPLRAKQLSGGSMIQWNDGSLVSCIPTQDLQCDAVTYKPGYCYRSSDNGETWLQRTTSSDHECPVLNVDAMIVLDGSGSIGQSNFGIIRNWVVNISRKFDIDGGSVKMGVVQYSHWFNNRDLDNQPMMKIEIGLGEHDSSADFEEAVGKLSLQGYTTYTAHALNVTAEAFRKSDRFRDEQTKKVLILLTDGASHDHYQLPETANYIRSLGIIPYAIGVGQAVQEELRIIATGNVENPTNVYKLDSFDDLQRIVSELETQILKTALEGSVGSTSNSYEMEMAEMGFSSSRSTFTVGVSSQLYE